MKRLIRGFLGLFGYDIAKVVPTPLFKKEVSITVAGSRLQIPIINPLRITYKKTPAFASEIARIASCIHHKYPGFTTLDIGANIGDTAATIKSVVDIPIVCVEGDPFTFEYLKRNTEQFRKITLFRTYLGEKEETLNVTIEKKGWNSTIIPDKESQQQIPFITLDRLLESNFSQKEVFKFLKIDTEGFDTIILRGALNLLADTKPVLYFEFNQDNMRAINEDGLSMVYRLANFGYETILFYDDTGRFILSTSLQNKAIIDDLNNYTTGHQHRLIYYYNICLVHKQDTDIAQKIVESEKKVNQL